MYVLSMCISGGQWLDVNCISYQYQLLTCTIVSGGDSWSAHS